MVPTTGELARNLQRVEDLIAALGAPSELDDRDIRDLAWLLTRRRDLTRLLALRRALSQERIVDLRLWCYGPSDSGQCAAGTERHGAGEPRAASKTGLGDTLVKMADAFLKPEGRR